MIARALPAVATGVFCFAATTLGQAQAPSTQVQTGEYLATAGNCVSCHTTADGEPFAGGVAFQTPFGTVYSTNITADDETGIGSWSKEQFRRAMREGIAANGDRLYPVFPYTSFTKLSAEDVDALFAFLQTVAPVRYRAPGNKLSFPYSQRWLMSVWNGLYFDAARFVADSGESAEWNRGKYLVEALGHCGACHTPRNFLGAEKPTAALSGGSYLDEVRNGRIRPWSAVNLTQADTGLRAWSIEDIEKYLKSGWNRFATNFGPMNEVIVNSTRHLTDADVRAMAVYLKSLPPQDDANESKASVDVLTAGRSLYAVHCGTCHLPNGLGFEATGTAIVGNPVVQAKDPASLLNVILYGPKLPDPAPPLQRQHMDGYAALLDNYEVAAIASFIRSEWDNRGGAVTAEQVAKQR